MLLQAQTNPVEGYLKLVREGKHAAFAQEGYAQPEAVLEGALPYLQDSVVAVRVAAYGLVGEAGLAAERSGTRSRSLSLLVEALAEPGLPAARAGQLLPHFYPNDFTEASRTRIVEVVQVNPSPQQLRLAGWLNIQALKPQLWQQARDKQQTQSMRWSAYLALARMGEPEATSFVVNAVRKQPVNDALVYDLLPDLAWVRQPEAMAYLQELLMRDSKDCSSADAETGGRISCAYRIMELIAPTLKGFPLATGPLGDIETHDYEKALILSRAWLEAEAGRWQFTNRF